MRENSNFTQINVFFNCRKVENVFQNLGFVILTMTVDRVIIQTKKLRIAIQCNRNANLMNILAMRISDVFVWNTFVTGKQIVLMVQMNTIAYSDAIQLSSIFAKPT